MWLHNFVVQHQTFAVVVDSCCFESHRDDYYSYWNFDFEYYYFENYVDFDFLVVDNYLMVRYYYDYRFHLHYFLVDQSFAVVETVNYDVAVVVVAIRML